MPLAARAAIAELQRRVIGLGLVFDVYLALMLL